MPRSRGRAERVPGGPHSRAGASSFHRGSLLPVAALPLVAALGACRAYDRGRYAALLDASVDATPSLPDGGHDAAPDAPAPDASPCGSCPSGALCCGVRCVDPLNDPDHCGDCARACPHTTCGGGTCTNTCLLGFDDCNHNLPADGCEVDLSTDGLHCGRCGNACNLPHARQSCVGGQCTILACDPGFGDCNANPADGCETDFASNPDHCGSCDQACTAPPGALATCAMGLCGFACSAGLADCTPAAGCETRLDAAATCGSCTNACTGGTPVCSSNGGVQTCTSGCAGATPLRCGTSCVDPMSDPLNCGGCGLPCATPAHGTATCRGGTCGITCAAGYHACGSLCASNSSPSTCGTLCTACPAVTNATANCDGTTCGFSCNAGYHLCGTVCRSSTSPSYCGTSCAPCPVTPNGTPTCTMGTCGIACNAGFTACSGLCVALQTDATHCGACATVCAPGTTCTAGVCTEPCRTVPGYTGALTGCITQSHALAFSGALDQYASVPNAAAYNLGTGSFTIEGWARIAASTTSSYPTLLSRRQPLMSTAGFFLAPCRSGCTLLVQTAGLNTLVGTASLFDDVWHHIAVTRTAAGGVATFVFYVDGVEIGRGTNSLLDATLSGPLSIGWDPANPTSQRWNGRIHNVRLWTVARTSTEIHDNMFVTLGGTTTGLVGSWSLDEGVGQTLHDSSATRNDGMLGGSTAAEAADPAWSVL